MNGGFTNESAVRDAHRFHLCIPPFVVALIIPVALLLIWHLQNHRLPNDDAADYATTGYQIFEQFQSRGLESGLLAFLNLRGWRPVLFPTFLVPFLLLFQGNIPLAVGGVLGTIYCLLAVYVYRLARLVRSPWRASLAAVLTVTLPILMQFATAFFAELTWVCFAMAWSYHLIRSEEFQSQLHSATSALFLGLMILTRPGESVAIAVIPLSYYIIQALRHKNIRMTDLIVSMIPVLISCGILLASVFMFPIGRSETWLLSTATSAACLAVAFRKQSQLSRGFVLFWTCFSIVNAFWWAGFERQFYDWIYTTSFGHMAAVTAPPRHAHILTTTVELIDYYGPLEIAWIGVAGGLLLIGRTLRTTTGSGSYAVDTGSLTARAAEYSNAEERQFRVIAGGAVVPILILYWLSHTGDPRRLMVGFTFAMLAFAIAALREERPLGKSQIVLAGGLVFFQLWHALPAYVPIPPPVPIFGSCCGSALWNPWKGTDGNQIVSDVLARKLPPNSTLAAYTLALFSFPNRIYEPAALKLAFIARKSAINVGYLWDEGAYDAVLRRLAESGYRFILLDKWDNAAVRESQDHMPYVHFTTSLIHSIAKSDHNPPGLRLIDSFTVSGREQLLYEIATQKVTARDLPDDALSWLDENIAAARNGGRAITSSAQAGFPSQFLNDDRREAWGSAETADDSYAAIVLPRERQVDRMRLVLFSPGGRAHLRDLSVVAADVEFPQPNDWRVIRSRVEGQQGFSQKITVPALPDNSVVTIEIDANDMNAGPHKLWGIACFSRSRDYARNYLRAGAGIYIRELQMRARPSA